MKTFLLIFIFALSLKAESSYQAKCVNSYYLTSTGTTYRINVTYSNTPTTVNVLTYSTAIINELVANNDKFKFDSTTGRCNAIITDSNNQILISSLTGILIGFTILFFSIFLTIKVGSRK